MTRMAGSIVFRTNCCGALYRRQAYASINLSAQEYWTDGKRVNSLFPNDGGLRQCQCGTFFLQHECDKLYDLPKEKYKPRAPKGWQRTKDTWGLWRKSVLKPESNVQFGEGGAGTFSDGKLWSQISDPRHLMRKVLHEFVKAGAPEEILYVSKPHIGTFRLVSMIEKMRAEIEALGGEIRFGQRVADLHIESGHLRGLVLANSEHIEIGRASCRERV